MSEEGIRIECREVGPFHKNGYLLVSTRTGEVACIDPGDEADQLLRLIEEEQWKLTAVLNTHAHMDHISGVGTVLERWKVPVYLHPGDAPLYNALQEQGRWFGLEYDAAPPFDHALDEGVPLRIGDLSVQVHHTPGHSPGSVCLEVGDHVFCGDAIFAGSIGRTDLPGGSLAVLMSSIREKILPLGDHKILHPGHGPQTTIAHERTTNPFLT